MNQGGKSGRTIRKENQGEQSWTTTEDNQEPENTIRKCGSIRHVTNEGKASYLRGEIFFKIKQEVTRQNHIVIHMWT